MCELVKSVFVLREKEREKIQEIIYFYYKNGLDNSIFKEESNVSGHGKI